MAWCLFSDWSIKILYAVCMHMIGDVMKIWVHKWKVSCVYCWCSVAVGCLSALLQVRTSWICVKICHWLKHPSCNTHTYQQYSNAQCVRFEVLTAVLLKVKIFWDVTQFHGVNSSPRFQGGH
jgi:hypothetical protein